MDVGIDAKPYTELLAGRAVAKVSPQRRHAVLQIRLGALVARLAGAQGDVGTEWRFYMSAPGDARTSLVPDIAFVARERLDALTPAQREQPHLSPDVAIEIRSPDDRADDVEWKMHTYLAMGSTLALDILPDAGEIRAFTRECMQIFRRGDALSCEAIPWLRFELTELFAEL